MSHSSQRHPESHGMMEVEGFPCAWPSLIRRNRNGSAIGKSFNNSWRAGSWSMKKIFRCVRASSASPALQDDFGHVRRAGTETGLLRVSMYGRYEARGFVGDSGDRRGEHDSVPGVLVGHRDVDRRACLLDEGNRMNEKSWASLAPLLDHRRSVESVVAGIRINAIRISGVV